ncbi:PDDEXK family nuclease [Vitreoscilla filiformis]|nr:hypothetical protein [Vitreoscilla filiformis]
MGAMGVNNGQEGGGMAESNEVLGVHVCIATEQVLANALPLRLLPWQRVIVVASDHLRGKQRGKLMQFLRWAEEEVLRRGGVPQVGIRVVELRDEGMHWGDLLGFARRLAAELMLELAPGQRLDVNVTGGTKLMTEAFATAFAGQARLVYCNTQGQALEVLDACGEVPPLPLPPDLLSLPEYLRAQGHELLGCQGGGDAVWWRGVAARRALTVALVQEGTRLRMTPGLHKRQRLLNGLHGVAAGCLPQPARGPQQPARGFAQEGVLEGGRPGRRCGVNWWRSWRRTGWRRWWSGMSGGGWCCAGRMKRRRGTWRGRIWRNTRRCAWRRWGCRWGNGG